MYSLDSSTMIGCFPWTLTGYFSNSTGSSVTSSRFSRSLLSILHNRNLFWQIAYTNSPCRCREKIHLFGVSNSIATMDGSLGMYVFFGFVLNETRNALNNVWTWDILRHCGFERNQHCHTCLHMAFYIPRT